MKWVEIKDGDNGGKRSAYYADEGTGRVLAYIDEIKPRGIFDVIRRDYPGLEGGHYPVGTYLDYEKAKEAIEDIYFKLSLKESF